MFLDDKKKINLDRSSPVPLYYQICKILSDQLKDPEMLGTKIPAEEKLMKVFGVSRATIRRALQSLEMNGMIERVRGKGTKVISSTSLESLTTIRSFSEQMYIENHVPITQVIETSWIPTDDRFIEIFKIPEGEKILRITRLRGNEVIFPLVLFVSYLSPKSGLTGNENFNGSLYEILKRINKPVIDGDAVIEAKLAEGRIAKLLKIDDGSPILYYERLGKTFNNIPIELVEAWYVGNHYKFKIHLSSNKREALR